MWYETDIPIAARKNQLVLLLLGCLSLASFVYGFQMKIWNPRDEIAHYDYIDKAGHLDLPTTFEPISPHTLQLSNLPGWYGAPSFDGTAKSMGLAGQSYEAHQPPLYYLLLGGPNRLIEAVDLPARWQIAVLRWAGNAFHILGALLLVFCFAVMKKTGLAADTRGGVFALLALSTNVALFSTLGNDSLSFLFGCLSLSLAAWSLRDPRSWVLHVCLLTTGLSVWCKWTNLGLIPAILAVLIINGRLTTVRSGAGALGIALCPLLGLAIFNEWVHDSVLGAASPLSVFSQFVHPFDGDKFLPVLVMNAFSVGHLGWSPDWRWGFLIIVVVVARGLFTLVFGVRRESRPLLLESSFCLITLALLGTAYLLNARVEGVHWHAFRHYSAFLPFLYGGIFGLGSAAKDGRNGLSFVAIVAGVVVLIRMVLALH